MVDRIIPLARKRILKRHTGLLKERSAYDSHWRSIADNLLPRSSRFTASERNRNRGDRNGNIIDSTATQALRVLAAGMMAGMTSPARPWFRLTTPDADVEKSPAAREWLFTVQQIMLRIFAKSNTYNSLHACYRELGAFGSAASVLVSDSANVIHHHPQTIGEYCFGLNHLGYVSTFSREFDLTVEQVVQWFGLNNVSINTKNAYDIGNYDKSVTLVHVIEPRAERNPMKRDNLNMPWADTYIEKAGDESGPNGGILQTSGHKAFPILSPRWDVLWNDSYGSGPGMDALGDLMQLQHQQYRKAKAIDYQSDPPLQLPTSLRNQETDLLPGGVTYYDQTSGTQGIRSAFEVQLDLGLVLADIGDVRDRLNRAFYADLFLMLSMADKNGLTATEVAERHEEKMLMIGPVLERLHSELLGPLIEATFSRMVESGIVPPPPDELAGQQLDVEYVSMLAQAQKAVSVNSTDRLIGHLGVLANIKPDVVDKFDADLSVERYADQLGVDPDLIVGGETLQMIRSQRAQAQAAAAASEQALQAAEIASKVGGIPAGGVSGAAQDIGNLFSGYGSPSAVEV